MRKLEEKFENMFVFINKTPETRTEAIKQNVLVFGSLGICLTLGAMVGV